jgi:hypothetical protein
MSSSGRATCWIEPRCPSLHSCSRSSMSDRREESGWVGVGESDDGLTPSGDLRKLVIDNLSLGGLVLRHRSLPHDRCHISQMNVVLLSSLRSKTPNTTVVTLRTGQRPGRRKISA